MDSKVGFWIAVFSIFGQSVVGRMGGDSGDIPVEVMSHSFSSPFVYDSSRPNWFLSGSTIGISSVRSSLIMNPSIPDRHGLFLNTVKFDSMNNFDLTFTMHLDGGSEDSDQAFSVIFSSRNMTSDLQSSVFANLKSDALDYVDILSKFSMDKRTMLPSSFNGVAIVFSIKKTVGVTIIQSDGRRELGGDQNQVPIPLKEKLYIRLRVKVTPTSVALFYQEKNDWVKLTERTNFQMNPSGFIGMTSYSGQGRYPYRVRLSNFHLKSLRAALDHDFQQIEKSSLAERSDQIAAINALFRILKTHSENKRESFSNFQKSIHELQNEANEILKIIAETRLPKQSAELVAEIQRIHASLSATDAERETLLEGAKVAAFEKNQGESEYSVNRHFNQYRKSFAANQEELNQAISSNNHLTLILLVFGVTIAMGVSFYRRLQKYASKDHMY